MIRKSYLLLALALVAAAVAAPIAESSSRPKVDPLAVGYLMGMGYTPNQIHAWTVGGCSHQVKPAACFGPSRGANLTDDGATVDPLAVSYLIGYGLTPSQVRSWTVGACSQRLKATSCYAMFKPAWWSSATTSSTKQLTDSTGFQWGDAGIGAAFTLGALLLIGGVGTGLLLSRKNRRRVAHA